MNWSLRRCVGETFSRESTVDTELISEAELDYRLHQCDPVDRAAIGDEAFATAVASIQRKIETDAGDEAPLPAAARPIQRRRLVTAGVAAAVVAVASLVGLETLGSGGGVGLPLAVPPAAAAQLNRVARSAARQTTATIGQWEYLAVRYETTGPAFAAHATVAFTDAETEQSWSAPNRGNAYGLIRDRRMNDGISFPTRRDRTIYLANRSAFDAGAIGQSMTRSVITDGISRGDGSYLPIWESSPTSDPLTLLNEICTQRPSKQHVSAGTLAGEPPALIWNALNELLIDAPSSKERAAGYKALAYLPGAKVVGPRTDQLGRRGVELDFTNTYSNLRETLIVSPTTGNALEEDSVLKHAEHDLPAGTVEWRELFLQRGVVRSDTTLPGGGRQPYRATSPDATASKP